MTNLAVTSTVILSKSTVLVIQPRPGVDEAVSDGVIKKANSNDVHSVFSLNCYCFKCGTVNLRRQSAGKKLS
eukprot:scaffold14886_cov108-Cylindrotheca_fusiformis.AAC.2